MSTSQNSVNGSGKLYASRRDLYADKDVKKNCTKNCDLDKADCSLLPRHRIAGKPRMPPYVDAPLIKVPEPRTQRSQSRTRPTSKEGKKNGSQATRQAQTCAGLSDRGDVCASVMNEMRISEPLVANDALVMVLPKTYLSSAPSTTSTSSHRMTSKDSTRENRRVSFGTETAQYDQKDEHILGKKVPPLYIPRPCHEIDNAEWDSDEATLETSESEDENETPWGKRLAAIKVSRIKRDFDEETVSIDTPEGTLPVCARCGVVVYLAEENRAAGRRFHISCFKCFICNSNLDSVNLYERNQEVYCKSCYIRQFGPKGYDYGPGEGALKME